VTDAAALEAAATRENGLDTLFSRERRRADRRLALPVALLSSRGLFYLFRRALVLLSRVPLRTALHVAEVVVLSDVLELGMVGRLLAIRSLVAAAGAFHWGALEPLRQVVRREVRSGHPAAAELETARYLRLAIDFCIVELCVLVAWLEFGPRPFHSFSILDAYAIGCGLRLMTETITRTYHAGVFAVRRVRRPLGTFLAVDLADAGTALVLFPWLGFWGFAVAQVVGGAVESALTFVYARRAYQGLPFPAPTLRRVLSEKAGASLSLVGRMIVPGIGNLVSQVDALLITALALGASDGALGLATGLHVLRPVLGLGTGWARLFYFDLTRLDGGVRRLFRRRFERLLLLAAPYFALASIGAAALLGALLSGSAPLPVMLGFTPFIVVRSLFAAGQIQAFTRGAYASLVVGSAVVLLAVWVVPNVHGSGVLLLFEATAALAVAALVFHLGRGSPPDADEPEPIVAPLAPFEFLARVEDSPLGVHVLWLNPRAGARATSIARGISTLAGVAFVTRFARQLVLCASEEGPSLLPRLVEASGGALEAAVWLPREPNGRRALAELLERELGGPGADAPDAASGTALPELFAREFAGGSLLTASRGAVPRGEATPRELARTLRELGAAALGFKPARRRGLRAAVYAPRGEAALLFVAPRAASAERFAAFERLVYWRSVRATLEPDAQ
jgi:hypothetical protein